jgi:ABC-type uncharacterized transport system permease subunit
VLLNWQAATNGPNGIAGIPRPTFFGLDFVRNPPEGTQSFHQYFGLPFAGEHRVIFMYFLILFLALFTNFVVLRLRRLPIGRAWEALREDEIACKALGINPTNTKLTAFALGAMFGGFAGSFFATRRASSAPRASPSSRAPSSWPSSCWAGWAARSASCWPRSSWSCCPRSRASSSSTGCCCSARRWWRSWSGARAES